MWTESNTPSKIEGAGGADVPKALIYLVYTESFVFPLDNEMKNRYKSWRGNMYISLYAPLRYKYLNLNKGILHFVDHVFIENDCIRIAWQC